jgi:hypothetical protein
MHVLANLEHSPALQRIYAIDWALIPNLAMDAVVPLLSRIVPLNDAGKIFLSAIVVMWIAGPLVLHHALFGRLSFWPLIAGFFAYNWCLALGMLNFVFGAGLSFFVLAAWVYSEEWPPVWRFLLFFILANVLFFCHLVSFAIYALGVLGFEAARTIQNGGMGRAKHLLWHWVLVLGQFAAPAIIFLFFSPTMEEITPGDAFVWGGLKDRLNAARSPVLFEWGPIDYLTLGITAGIFIYALVTRSLRAHRAFMWAILLLLLVAILMPAGSDGQGLRHIRVPPVLAALVFAGTTWIGKPSRKAGVIIFALCTLLFLTRTGITVERWQRYDARLIEFRQAISEIGEGSSLISVLSDERPTDYWRTNPDPVFPFLHAVDYATIINSAFTPSVFATPGAQPIRQTASYAAIDVKLGPFVTWDQLQELAAGGGKSNLNLSHWPQNYDYVVVINLDQRKLEPPGFLTVFHTGSFFTIFKIEK